MIILPPGGVFVETPDVRKAIRIEAALLISVYPVLGTLLMSLNLQAVDNFCQLVADKGFYPQSHRPELGRVRWQSGQICLLHPFGWSAS